MHAGPPGAGHFVKLWLVADFSGRNRKAMPMTSRQGRMGAGLAGVLLLAISLADWALGIDNPDAVNLITGVVGAALLAWGIVGR